MLYCIKHSAINEERNLRLKCGKQAQILGEVLVYSMDRCNISVKLMLL